MDALLGHAVLYLCVNPRLPRCHTDESLMHFVYCDVCLFLPVIFVQDKVVLEMARAAPVRPSNQDIHVDGDNNGDKPGAGERQTDGGSNTENPIGQSLRENLAKPAGAGGTGDEEDGGTRTIYINDEVKNSVTRYGSVNHAL